MVGCRSKSTSFRSSTRLELSRANRARFILQRGRDLAQGTFSHSSVAFRFFLVNQSNFQCPHATISVLPPEGAVAVRKAPVLCSKRRILLLVSSRYHLFSASTQHIW